MPYLKSFKSREDYLNYYREYRIKNKKQLKEYKRLYISRFRKKTNYAYDKKYYKENPAKIQAKNILNSMVRCGFVKRLPCQVCGEIKSEAHHDDYNEPLLVRWLCSSHHKYADIERRKKLSPYLALSKD